MVFRRENKVDTFQRQMSALRQQLGTNESERTEYDPDMPELDDERYAEGTSYDDPADAVDNGDYSFGSYPAQAAPTGEPLDESAVPAIPEIPQVDGQVSVVARGTTWKGNVESEASVYVYGRVEGELTAREDIWIAQGAEVSATVVAQRVIVAGNIGGTIRASERFEALPQGKITADVYAPTFVVHEGASINGQLRMSNGSGSESKGDRSSAASIIQRRTRPGA